MQIQHQQSVIANVTNQLLALQLEQRERALREREMEFASRTTAMQASVSPDSAAHAASPSTPPRSLELDSLRVTAPTSAMSVDGATPRLTRPVGVSAPSAPSGAAQTAAQPETPSATATGALQPTVAALFAGTTGGPKSKVEFPADAKLTQPAQVHNFLNACRQYKASGGDQASPPSSAWRTAPSSGWR